MENREPNQEVMINVLSRVSSVLAEYNETDYTGEIFYVLITSAVSLFFQTYSNSTEDTEAALREYIDRVISSVLVANKNMGVGDE